MLRLLKMDTINHFGTLVWVLGCSNTLNLSSFLKETMTWQILDRLRKNFLIWKKFGVTVIFMASISILHKLKFILDETISKGKYLEIFSFIEICYGFIFYLWEKVQSIIKTVFELFFFFPPLMPYCRSGYNGVKTSLPSTFFDQIKAVWLLGFVAWTSD